MRLASGIAPIRRMLDQGVKVGLGVDGSASNDGGNLMGEARQSLLLQRVGYGSAALCARQTLEMATRGGAAVLGRDNIGHLAPAWLPIWCEVIAREAKPRTKKIRSKNN